MRKKWQIVPIALLLTLAIVATGITVFAGTSSGIAFAQPVWSEITVSENYDYGADFEVPERTVTLGDDEIKATSVVVYPDGTATRQTKIALNQSGLYTIKYTAVAKGAAYVDEVTFTVIDPLFSVSDPLSSVEYGLYDSIAAGATKAVTTSGLMVRLAAGDKLTVNKLIDVNELTKDDVLFEAFVTPDTMGRADFTNILFTLTDATNPDVFLRFSGRQSAEGDEYPVTYFLAGGNGQVLAGYEKNWDRIHINNEWGTYTHHTFTGKFRPGEEFALDTRPMSIRYDEGEDAAYAGELMIIDFDDPKYFATLWKGFATGYARLTIEADAYNGDTANFCVTKIRGVDLTDTTVDAETPVITVDGVDERMPEAKVGGTYPVPKAKAFDNYCGYSNVTTKVYYNYASANAINVPVQNGRFATDRAGNYAIVYEATNRKGKSAEEIVWVHAGDAIDAIQINNSLKDQVLNKTLGEWVETGDTTASGGSGNNPEIRTYVEFDGASTEIKGGFRPEKTGDYTVKIIATDYIGDSETATFAVHAEPGDKPVFIDAPTLPKYFIGGATYVLPEVYANDYSSGSCVRKVATAEIGGETYRAGDEFVPEVENNGDAVEVAFKCENATLTVPVKTVKAYVPNGDYEDLHMENYLMGEGVDFNPQSDHILVTATEADGGWEFANTLLSENFDLQIIGAANASYFEGLDVILTDSEDESISVLIKLLNTGEKANIQVNATKINVSYGFVNSGTFNLGFAGTSVTVGGSEIEVTECVDGSAFKGFPSDRIRLEVRFSGAIEGGSYMLSRINGQRMSDEGDDRIGPKISIMNRDYGGCASIGDTRVLPYATAGDTLDPNVEFTLTVEAPDGSVCTDVNGKALSNVDPSVNYEIKLDSYGNYSIRYEATEKYTGRMSKWSYIITVEDEIAPEIEFAHEFVTTVKAGETIVIPDFTVSDNISESKNIRVLKYVKNPNGEMFTLPADSNSFKTAMAGEYEVRIMLIDEAGNVNLVRVTVTATEA